MPLTLSKLTPIPGLSFNDKDGKHIHLINGKEVPGCTTISGLFSEDGWKFAWPVKLMYEKSIEHFKTFDGHKDRLKPIYSFDIIEGTLKEAKNAWRDVKKFSANVGTMGHAIIEEYVKGCMKGEGAILLPPYTKPDKEIENILIEFVKWESKYKPVWLASELQVGSKVHQFAGILDALAEIDGKLVLMDFKTSSGIKPEYSIQLAGLQICLEEMGIKPSERAILHLPKEGEYEYRVLDGNLEFEKQAFLAAKTFYGFKSRFMGRGK